MPLTSQMFEANGQTIHANIGGPKDAPVMLLLHGFPEYWVAWAGVAEKLLDAYRVVLPDQRGFNLSSKPVEQEAYATKLLVADMVALIDQISPDRPIILCGHDWGASVAYALAMRNESRVSQLIIANGVHPMCFQKALFAGGSQTDASQYMNVLCENGVDERLSANGYEKLLSMFEKFSSAPWLDDHIREQYRTAWSKTGALPAMLNWYRSSPMVVPKNGTPAKDFPITDNMRVRFRISMPHLLLWGVDDSALLKEAREDLPEFVNDLTVIEMQNASHWLLHEHAETIAGHMREFLTK